MTPTDLQNEINHQSAPKLGAVMVALLAFLIVTPALPASRVLAQAEASLQTSLYLKDGDTVVFLGDELTDAPSPVSSNQYSVLVESFFAVRYPDLRVRWINAGWANDTAARALLRLDRDVLAHQPNVVVICLGLNDPEYLPFDREKLDTFQSRMQAIVERCQQAGVRVWLISPPSIEAKKEKRTWIKRRSKPSAVDLSAIRYNATLDKYAKCLAEIAKTTKSGFVDWFHESVQTRRRERRKTAYLALTRDGRLPNARSHALVATGLLRAWQAQPIRVTIDLDWERGHAQIKTHVTGNQARSVAVEISEAGPRILQLNDLPLPWPMASGADGVLAEGWEAADMCVFLFRMVHPPERGIVFQQQGSDKTSVKPLTVTGDQLRTGFNLATTEPLRSNPVVTKLFKLIGTKNYYRYGTWRKLKLSPPKEPELAEAHRQLVTAWATYVRGCEEIIFNSPKVFDVKLVLGEAVRPETLLTHQPRPHRPSIKARPVTTQQDQD